MSFSIIAAIDQKRGIGKNNGIPWYLPGDFKHFAKTTTKTQDPENRNAVVMGSKTWQSLPEKYRPLPNRLNVVLNGGNQLDLPENAPQFDTFEKALKHIDTLEDIEKIFIIGGGVIYRYAITKPECNELYITHLFKTFDCDTFFPEIPVEFKEVLRSEMQDESGTEYQFVKYQKL